MVFEKICALIAEQFGVSEDDLSKATLFVEDLGADSVDLVELMMAIEEEFDIEEIDEDDAASIKTIGDAVKLISAAE